MATSLLEMWREKSNGGGPPSPQQFLLDMIESEIAQFRADQITSKNKNKSEPAIFRCTEDFRPKQKNALSPQGVQRALFLLDSGLPPKTIAQRLNCSMPTMYRILHSRDKAVHVQVKSKSRAHKGGRPMIINPEKAAERET
jgi:hypothetical protein